MGGIPGLQSAEASHDDARMLLAARADLTKFAPLYERYFPRIYAYCLRRVEHAEAAEDLTSLIFTRALTSLHEHRGGSVARPGCSVLPTMPLPTTIVTGAIISR